MRRHLVLLTLLAGIGCWPAWGQTPGSSQPEATPPVVEAKDAEKSKIDPKNYVIGPEDILFVAVWREPELSGQRSKKYFISGEVLRPGAYPLLNQTTVLQALVNAGGFRDFANTKKIIILRGDERFKFNYKEVIKGKRMEQNILLQNGDQIIIP
jgi:protein involved in polysaccharide export with SLBB domain